MRANYTLGLEIVPTAPLTHGMGNDGNRQVLRRQEYRVPVVDPETLKVTYEDVDVPCVSGAAFKATLRESALWHMIDVLGLRDEPMSMDTLRLLLKGGKTDSSGSSLSLDRHRGLRRIFPMLAVFGWMDDGLSGTAEGHFSDVRPYCRELLDAGLIPETLEPLHVGALPAGEPIRMCSLPPIALAQIITDRQYYAHDLRSGHGAKLLDASERKAIEDQQAEQKRQHLPAEQRRAVNESMPHAYEAIAPGVPMVAEIRLLDATEVEWDCLRWAIFRWIATGAHLGGGATKGHGACRVRISGALTYAPGGASVFAQPGAELTSERAGQAYVDHLRSVEPEIRAHLSAAKGTADAKAKRGKKGKMLDEAEAE